jgi:hypothetical protein
MMIMSCAQRWRAAKAKRNYRPVLPDNMKW